MLTYYQPFLLPFLRLKQYILPQGITRMHFLSFEDALWTLLASKNVPKNSVILVPDFYCMDVVENIKKHGYRTIFYPLDDHFQVSTKTLHTYINTHKPSVIIIFHACGITNKLFYDSDFINNTCNKSILIEDSVQRLTNPPQVTILHSNHYLMDSLRKVSPLSGSFIYGKAESFTFQPQSIWEEWQYVITTCVLYILFRVVFTVGVLIQSTRLISFAHKKILKAHDDLIGDSRYGYKGHWHDRFLHTYFDFSKIEKLKERQSTLYRKVLNILQDWYPIEIPVTDYKLLHAYPVGIRMQNQKQISDIELFLERNNAPVWFKFSDSPWAKSRGVLFLPLGFHVTESEIRSLASLLSIYS